MNKVFAVEGMLLNVKVLLDQSMLSLSVNLDQNVEMSAIDTLKVLSVNCKGLQDKQKRVDVLSYLKAMQAYIICLQDTHLVKKDA